MNVRVERPDRARYRLSAGVMLFSRTGQVWVGRRVDTPDAWQMPQGGIDAGEDPLSAARRELREEVGSDNAKLLAESAGWLRYDLPPPVAARMWRGRYRGQAQKWFAFRFLGDDSQFDIHRAAEPEFDAWRWIDIDELPRLIVDFKRPVYEAVVAEFRDLASRADPSGCPAADR